MHALEKILELPAAELHSTMDGASQLMVELLGADKVDIFFLDPSIQTLVAHGVSDTPLARKEKRLGLDRLQLANRGRIVEVFETGRSWHTGHQDEDPEELPGIKYGLGIRSVIAAPIEVGGERRGVLECSSVQAEFFSMDDLHFLGAAARWVGVVAHRVELVESLTKAATAQGRRAVAEELITVLAHDMGNYLAPLRARVELIRRRAVRAQSADDLRDAEAALTSIEAIARLTSDLLDVGRLDQGLFTLRVQPLDVMRLVQEVVEAAKGPGREVQHRGPEELLLVADPERLRQALSNLVANALKHSPAGLPVVVEVERQTRMDGSWVVLSVIDQGPGVPPHLLPRLFERFVHGPGSSGLGLGLYLARQIATLHGGTLEVHSSPGRGARFELALPAFRA
ncbi:GAF domain-containing sensor histidine kinase [Archangium sp.]|uniref:GAF domain-containing sensor histidine kinase n=1 Tax=Archangium sp. TaxID=1872627 RepID=UPI002D6B02EB|nr:GAF domain-containing sensor histidine kinase [Archangium sp.]HYO52451.1 GAF domain-containing sensor histidine kinase [Archangium sp.]